MHTQAELHTEAFRKPIQKSDPNRQTELLTGNPVDQTFKNRSKAGRF